jgi:hypothetical protein
LSGRSIVGAWDRVEMALNVRRGFSSAAQLLGGLPNARQSRRVGCVEQPVVWRATFAKALGALLTDVSGTAGARVKCRR